MQAAPKPSKRNPVLVKVCFSHAPVPQQHIVDTSVPAVQVIETSLWTNPVDFESQKSSSIIF